MTTRELKSKKWLQENLTVKNNYKMTTRELDSKNDYKMTTRELDSKK